MHDTRFGRSERKIVIYSCANKCIIRLRVSLEDGYQHAMGGIFKYLSRIFKRKQYQRFDWDTHPMRACMIDGAI